jgi:phage gp46-like protein
MQSLFTDLESAGGAGYWGDTVTGRDRDAIAGSRLWMVKKTDQESLTRAGEYIADALQWMIDDRIAEYVTVTPTKLDAQRVEFKIVIRKISGDELNFLFVKNWENEKAWVEQLQ